MASLRRSLSDAVIRRVVEETLERAMREGQTSGVSDENAIARRFFRLIAAEGSPLADAMRAIPGGRFAPGLGLSLTAEYLREQGGNLFPGDSRLGIGVLRHMLQNAAPTLEGIGEATSDVLERQIDVAVDSAKAPPSSSTKGVLDLVQVWFVDGKSHLIIPILVDGEIVQDDRHDPVPSNLSPEMMSVWLSDRFTKSSTKKERNKDGKGFHDEPVPPAKRSLSQQLNLRSALQLLGGAQGLTPEQVDRIQELTKPQPSWESRISPRVDHVLSWLIDVLSLSVPQAGTAKATFIWTPLERQEVEDLVQRMKSLKPDPDWVNRRLGRFEEEVEKLPLQSGRVYGTADIERIGNLFSRIRNEIDITLEGEQSPTTKMRKGLEAAPGVLAQVRDVLSTAMPLGKWVFYTWCVAFVMALVLLILGIILPDGWFTISCAVVGGILGFAITWPLPFMQTIINVIRGIIPGKIESLSDDWLKDLGRRIAFFALPLGCGILPIFIWLEFPALLRILLVSGGVLAPMGALFGYTLVERKDLAQKRVLAALSIYTWVLTIPTVAMVLLVGLVRAVKGGKPMTGPQFVQWIWGKPGDTLADSASSVWTMTTGHWFGLIVVLAVGVSLLSLGLSRLQLIRGGTMAIRNPIAKWMVALVAIAGVIWILVERVDWNGSAPTATVAPATAPAQKTSSPSASDKKASRKELCEQERVSDEKCREWVYK